ncbi:BREX-1 system adenine-specific DNA-methyltransferase PglX [Clostridium cochlearium]|uniref:BREX-1 system adenine-specific DNA-methyltransferase PglX n=1 Tax=Clostridium cochlearium TaxID=1494 RepID=UPI001EDD8667|nr:BREX-1 system adenine-specific DNA-methyltransferase PglX [Clostridium cochlearium]MBV1818012.1 BREX-1 system adenine-specific DNA-methyltransferase PglX [Bacteroidales bacterium MSK.15.36]MCG4580091.1 BREX-1 system adenine-specific DNA-methyltransferase PglX [Clostridium cochlearium]
MDKSAIKNFAVRARNKLIEDITQKAYEIGITKKEIKDIETFEGGFKVKGLENSKIYKAYEIKQREKLIANIKDKGFEQIVEEVAYTWFNRFIALRFMEVNEYLPTGVRVLSSIEEGKIEPDIIKEALNIDFDLKDKDYDEYKEIVYRLIDANDTDDLYKYLLVKQCNQLGSIMPMVFEEISDYTELLLPDHLLAEGSVIRDLVESVKEYDYKDQVEIIGWMYQYYISEKKDEVFAGLKKNQKITKENIPAATQLFTPKWIVKYMVENSLGRLWLESHPDEELQSKWKYYLEEAEQDEEVQKKLEELKDPNLNPEDIKVLDPSMGSGHILVYAFDVLYDIYLKANYSERDIPQLILEKNLYGLDIDDRAGQLASFALMMKARSKNRRIFRRKIDLNICSIQESNGIPKEAIDFLVSPKDTPIEEYLHKEEIEYLIEVFHDAKEYGSILDVKKIDFDAIDRRIEEIRNGETLDLYELQYREIILDKLPDLIKQGRIMSDKYDVVCTNPPYMSTRGSMNAKLTQYLNKNYPLSKNDMFTVFMELGNKLSKTNGYVSIINQHSWMFLSGFSRFREKIYNEDYFINMLHLGSGAFDGIAGEVVQSVTFIMRKFTLKSYKGLFISLLNKKWENWIKTKKCDLNKECFLVDIKSIETIPNKILCYWLGEKSISKYYEGINLEQFAAPRVGLATGNNDKFIREWYEVNYDLIGFNIVGGEKMLTLPYKWIPYNKGGSYRKWYGNREFVVDWYKDGMNIKNYKQKRLLAGEIEKKNSECWNREYYFKESLSWSKVSTSHFAVRYYETGFIFDVAGCSILELDKNIFYFAGLLNSSLKHIYIEALSPTLNFETGAIKAFPVIVTLNNNAEKSIERIVKENILISKTDWDSFETSWDFKHHPLLRYSAFKNDFDANKIETAFDRWTDFTNEQFAQLKYNEEELNRIFIDIYGLQDELTPEVEDKDITISKADRKRDIKSFISYAVGCMFGRYSLGEEGLVYAGGEFDIDRYKTFIPTKDNILVIADDDYFEDDIVNRFVDFVKITFGKETLEENLSFIAETLGQKTTETSRQAIRRYFLKDFYKDHVRTYQKRPIYWLFDSGRQDGFKALIYMHRYDISTVARVRTDYLHRLQRMYEAEIDRLDFIIDSELPAREKNSARKKKDKINKQIKECLIYDQVIAHIAHQRIEIDLDDGVKHNYNLFQGVEVPQGEGRNPLKADLLSKI